MPLIMPSGTTSDSTANWDSPDYGMTGLKGTEMALRVLKGIALDRVDVVERILQKTDRSHSGKVKTEDFKAALNAAGLNLLSDETVRLCQTYSVDGMVHWPAFIKDICNVDEFSMDHGDSDRSELTGKSFKSDFAPEVRELLDQLSHFFGERRVLVSDSFVDFESMNNFADLQMNLILSHYQDSDGLVRYRHFIRDVEPFIDVSSGFVLPFHNNVERSAPPSRSNSSLNSDYQGRAYSGTNASSVVAGQSPSLLGVQPMGPADCQNPCRHDFKPIAGCRVSPASEGRLSVEDIMAKIRHFCATFNIILVDHMRVGDKLREGAMTQSQFRRIMDVLRVFKLSPSELEFLESEYRIEVNSFGNPDVRFNYRRFCEDLQPTGHDWAEKHAQLRRDDSSISPLAVNPISESEMSNLAFVMERIGTSILKRRLCFRQYFEDFDRTTKTRSGSTWHNYTLNAGCISRSQLVQVTPFLFYEHFLVEMTYVEQAMKSMGLSPILDDNDFSTLFKRYERNGEFNYLVFLRDVEDVEKRLLQAVLSPHV